MPGDDGGVAAGLRLAAGFRWMIEAAVSGFPQAGVRV